MEMKGVASPNSKAAEIGALLATRGGPTAGFDAGQSKARRPFAGTRRKEQDMTINKDQVEGRVKEIQGKIKEVVGNLVGNETLEAKGTIQKLGGEAQAKLGDLKQDVEDAKKGS